MKPSGEAHFELSVADQRLLDELVECGFDPAVVEPMPRDQRERAQRLVDLLGLLRDYPVEDADDTLIHATLARIDRFEEEHTARMSFDARRDARASRRGRRIRLPDFISVAAVILICASIVLPIINNLRREVTELKSRNNLQYVVHAVNTYARDYGGRVPTARAGLDNAVSSFTEAINLTPLVRQNYCQINDPSTVPDQGRPADRRLRPDIVLFLGDKNPIVEALRRGELKSPVRISLAEGRLSSDIFTPQGAILWLHQPQARPEGTRWRAKGVLWLKDDIHPDDGIR